MTSATDLPSNLPVPTDDGACDHLPGLELPSVVLTSTDDRHVDLAKVGGLVVLYIYPMSGPTNDALPDNWDEIPGARGCTPQACSFRDHYEELARFGASVYGLSTQSVDYLKGEVARLHLSYPLLSDKDLTFTQAMSLPVFDVRVAGSPVNKRVTLIFRDGVIAKVFYPVFPPDKNAQQVVDWLTAHA